MSDIGARIRLEGEAEYKRAIADINREQRVLASEMRAVSAEFDGNANSIDALTKKNQTLNKEHESQVKRIQTLNGALDKAKEVYGENSRQVDNWQIQLNNAQAKLSGLDKELQANNKHLDEAKKSTDGTAKSIDEYGKEVKTAEEETSKLGDTLEQKIINGAVIAGVAALAVGFQKLAKSAIGLSKDAAAYADDMLTMSETTGIAVDTLQELNYMQELTDVSLETMTSTMARQIRGLEMARKGTGDVAEGYRKLGVELTDSNGQFKNSNDIYWDSVDALGQIANETERDVIAMQIFGRSARDLVPVMNLGRDGVAEFAQEARDMGAVLDQETLEMLGETDDAFQRMTQSADILKREIGLAMAPAVERSLAKITNSLQGVGSGAGEALGGLTSMVADGFVWIIENSDKVIAGTAGIATAALTFKVGGAIHKGVTAVSGAWELYKKKTDGATVAQWALNTAQSASPLGILALGAGVAVTGLTALIISTKNATTEIEKTTKAISENIKERDKSTSALQGEIGAVSILSDELIALAEIENKTVSEKREMVLLVEQLNREVPDLNLAIDEQTFALSKTKEEIKEVTNALLEQYMLQAGQDRLKAIGADRFEQEQALREAHEKRAEAIRDLAKAEEEYISAGKNEDPYGMEDATRAIWKAQSQIEDMDDAIKKSEGNLAELEGQWNSTVESIKGYSDALDDASDKTTDTAEDIKATSADLAKHESEILKEHQKTLQKALDGRTAMYEKAYEEQLDALNFRLRAEQRAFKKMQDEQLSEVRRATDREIEILKSNHDKKLALIDEEYMARIKVVDEQRYADLKLIQEQIDGINELTKEEQRIEKQKEENAKRTELQTKIDKAKSDKLRHDAEKELAEFEAKLAYERLLAERDLQVEKLEAQKDTINDSYDLQVDALEEEQKARKSTLEEDYNARELHLKDVLKLKEEELKVIQEEEKIAFDKKHNIERGNLKTIKDMRLKSARETYNEDYEAFKSGNALKLKAQEAFNKDLLRANKKAAAEITNEYNKAFKAFEVPSFGSSFSFSNSTSTGKSLTPVAPGGSPLSIHIENFNNARSQDVQGFAQELEFYMRQTAVGRGGP